MNRWVYYQNLFNNLEYIIEKLKLILNKIKNFVIK